jgi:hypothetical protein
VKHKDEKAFGEYQTKRVILEVYDEMGESDGGGGGVSDEVGAAAC